MASPDESLEALDAAIIRLAEGSMMAPAILQLAKAWNTLHGNDEEEDEKPPHVTDSATMLESNFWADGDRGRIGFKRQPPSGV